MVSLGFLGAGHFVFCNCHLDRLGTLEARAGLAYAVIVLVILFGTVFAAVHHARRERSAGAGARYRETVAAISAVKRDQLQRSIDPTLGSSLAIIGLAIPAVSVAEIVLGKNLVFGLSPREMVLLAMTILISMLTLGNGRTNILFGLVHVGVFSVFLFKTFVP